MRLNTKGLRYEFKVMIISFYNNYFVGDMNEYISVAGRITHMKNGDYLFRLHTKLKIRQEKHQ